MAQALPRVPLLATVVLLLDDEGEAIGEQIAWLCQTLDPLASARLRLLRVSGRPGAVVAIPFAPETRALARPDPRLSAYGVPGRPFRASLDAFAQSDPGQTNLAAPMATATPLALEDALRAMLQEAARSGGAEPLAERGYHLVPNELAISLVGRVESPLLAEVAATARHVTKTLAAQTDARRLAFLVAAELSDAPRDGTPVPPSSYRPRPVEAAWREAAAQQPWSQLLSWRDGEPPLLYAFLYEAWDESSRYHWRGELRYAIAESIFALFATDALDHPAFKEALDLSTAALDDTGGLSRIGSIGTSRVSAPTEPMLDYLAHRLAADLLLRRGLLGSEAGVAIPGQPPSEGVARQDADRWIKEHLVRTLEGERYPLPQRLPGGDGNSLAWHRLAVGRASPDPAGLFWRWGPHHTGRVVLNDEAFWNLAAQNDVETLGESRGWQQRLQSGAPEVERQLRERFDADLRQRASDVAGIDHAGAFAGALSDALLAEARRMQRDQDEQDQRVEGYERAYEDELRLAHTGRGVPTMPNPPPSNEVPRLPRNMEAIAHEVLDTAFTRAPMPLTLALVALLAGIFGALAATPLAHLVVAAHGPHSWQVALGSGPWRHVIGAALLLALFALALIAPLTGIARLGRWQRRYAETRTLLWLARVKSLERIAHLQIIQALVQHIERERSHVRGWEMEVEQSAGALTRDAASLAGAMMASAALSRDVYVARGQVWEGIDPDDLYQRVRAQQTDEIGQVRAFLRAVQSAAGSVPEAIQRETLAGLALENMRRHLRDGAGEEPFALWSAETAATVLDRAREAARVPIQPLPGGRPLSHFDAVAAHPDVAWLPRLAEERHMVVLPLASPRWSIVIRATTRARHSLVR